ncbi:type I polyketide synthase [Colletotrichum scovillei]|uniref:type I polyketide synthase n=1 Tax=Colletotrichum scovillei TaxID=1209932 RepID=UPI0015C2F0BE|nr:type I polyketide synthase [Colletotrichum scovillei]KAF4772770.1 type I polyketide synthase [Colletotrichum scovillei]
MQDRRLSALHTRRFDGPSGGQHMVGDATDIHNPGMPLSVADTTTVAVHFAQAASQWKLSGIFLTSVEDIMELRPLGEYGFDSLVAVEFRTWLATYLGPTSSVFEAIQSWLSAALTSHGRQCSHLDMAMSLCCPER